MPNCEPVEDQDRKVVEKSFLRTKKQMYIFMGSFLGILIALRVLAFFL